VAEKMPIDGSVRNRKFVFGDKEVSELFPDEFGVWLLGFHFVGPEND